MVQQIMKGFQRVMEDTLDFLEKGTDFPGFEEKLWKAVHTLGRDILAQVLQSKDEELRKNRREREGWEVVRRGDARQMLTLFGDLTYHRTYYRNRETGGYAHLVDRYAGYRPRRRIDPLVEALILERVTDLSYRKGGEEIIPQNGEVRASPETVKRLVHHFPPPEETPDPSPPPSRHQPVKCSCPVLFVEADEDHVSVQGRGRKRKGTLLPKLVYVHEGKERQGKDRVRLQSPRYFAGLYEDAEDLWYTVLDYLEEHYDLEQVEQIFLCGDGAPWIKQGLGILPRSTFVLDRFHLEKRLKEALGACPSTLQSLRMALGEGDGEKARTLLQGEIRACPDLPRRTRLQDLWKYLRHHWAGILVYRQYPAFPLGVSAEGHVSHILSARLSSRPMSWSTRGVDRMSSLRAHKFNGHSAKHHYLRHHRQSLSFFTLSPEVIAREREKGKHTFQVFHDNIPALQGPMSSLRMALKGLSHDCSWVPCV